MHIERIIYERTGGFANLRLFADFEPDDFDEEQLDTLSDLLDDLDFAELPERLLSQSPMPDGFTYSITVEAEEWKHTVITSESAADEKMQALLELLDRQVRKKKAKKQ